jgi:hypothetical protein
VFWITGSMAYRKRAQTALSLPMPKTKMRTQERQARNGLEHVGEPDDVGSRLFVPREVYSQGNADHDRNAHGDEGDHDVFSGEVQDAHVVSSHVGDEKIPQGRCSIMTASPPLCRF